MKTYPIALLFTTSLFALGAPAVATAQGGQTPNTAQATPIPAASDADVVNGEVRKIDKGASKITLRHAEMPHLGMPGMTMVFRVQEPSLLDTVKVGDKVRFKAAKIGGAFVVVELQPAP